MFVAFGLHHCLPPSREFPGLPPAPSSSVTPPWGGLGEKGDLGMPKFLPDLPKPQQDRLEAIVEREATKWHVPGEMTVTFVITVPSVTRR